MNKNYNSKANIHKEIEDFSGANDLPDFIVKDRRDASESSLRFFGISPGSYNALVELSEKIRESDKDHFICETDFLRPYCVAFLDQLIANLDKTTEFSSTYSRVNQYLKQVNFPHLAQSAGGDKPFNQDYIIPLRRFNDIPDRLSEDFPTWLEQEVFAKSFSPDFSPKLKKQIVQNLWEIIYNAMQHSRSSNGISCCGQFYPLKGYFEIGFCDCGVGVPYHVRRFLKSVQKISDYDCIVWSLERGHTTKHGTESGGLGLYYLREFLRLNGGHLQIVSHKGMYQSKGAEILAKVHLDRKLPGTLFNLRIIYDNYRYQLNGE